MIYLKIYTTFPAKSQQVYVLSHWILCLTFLRMPEKKLFTQ